MKLTQFFATLSIIPVLSQWKRVEGQALWDNSAWSWFSGNTTLNVPGVYGSKGIPSPNNYPGGRDAHSMVFDAVRNCIYVFGGRGYPESSTMGAPSLLGDLLIC
jgi:hypothetical protein